MDIYYSDNISGVWQTPVNLGPTINTDSSETAPSISSDGTKLYFSSNRPGGYGGYDIWVSEKVSGVWQTLVNLGPVVNSGSDEKDPCISPDGTKLYFSSNRPGGYGGYDIWVSENDSGVWQTSVNLGPIINDTTDETGPCISYDNNQLYFGRVVDGIYAIYVSTWTNGIKEGYSSKGDSKLGQNFPNPSNYGTKIDYSIETAGKVSLTVYDIKGNIISKLVDEEKSPGEYSIFWNGLNNEGKKVPRGSYCYQLSIGKKVMTKKVILME